MGSVEKKTLHELPALSFIWRRRDGRGYARMRKLVNKGREARFQYGAVSAAVRKTE